MRAFTPPRASPRGGGVLTPSTSTPTLPSFLTILLHVLLFTPTSTLAATIPAKNGVLARSNADVSYPLNTYKTIAYYASWDIYGRNWPPQNLQASALTHVHYAFFTVDNRTGAVAMGDPYADMQVIYPGDDQNTTSGDEMLFGNLKQLYLLKKSNRGMKTLMSIGGWGQRFNFGPGLTNSTKNRQRFAETAVGMLMDLGFDGIDIDWEYPASLADAQALVDICRRTRLLLDRYSREHVSGNPHFLLSLAIPANPTHFPYFDIPGIMQYADYLMLMAYDYQGGFSNYSGHDANVYPSIRNPRSTDFNTQTAVENYLHNGLASSQLVLGMPLYSRSFANTAGPGRPFSPPNDTGSWGEAGVFDYKVLPRAGSKVHTDNSIIASWSYDNQTRYMTSYDTPHVAMLKAQYVEANGLGGAMWWEASNDRPLNDTASLIRTVRDEFVKCGQIEYVENVLEYPESRYVNMRAGMPGQ